MLPPDNYKTFHVGINAFVVREGKLLLGKRKNIFGSGTWGLPGGHLEPGETMIDAARRELFEETGLYAKEIFFSNLVNGRGQEKHYLQVGFIINGSDGDVCLKEPERCEEWNWFSISELPQDLFPPHIKQIRNFLENTNFIDD